MFTAGAALPWASRTTPRRGCAPRAAAVRGAAGTPSVTGGCVLSCAAGAAAEQFPRSATCAPAVPSRESVLESAASHWASVEGGPSTRVRRLTAAMRRGGGEEGDWWDCPTSSRVPAAQTTPRTPGATGSGAALHTRQAKGPRPAAARQARRFGEGLVAGVPDMCQWEDHRLYISQAWVHTLQGGWDRNSYATESMSTLTRSPPAWWARQPPPAWP